MEIDFEFRKERKMGEIVQDFINLLRLVLRHFFQTILSLSVVPLCVMLALIYYGTTKINLTRSESLTETPEIIVVALLVAVALLMVSLVFFGLAIEYFILLKNSKGTAFGSVDVWRSFRSHFGKYLRFLVVAIVAFCILFVPLVIAMFILMFIPLIGSFAAGILGSFVGVWFFSAFMFYREGYMEAGNAIQQSFSILKKKIIDYSISSYVVSFVFQVLLMMLSLMPTLILGVIAYNTIGFEDTFFDSFFGRFLVAAGATLLILLYIVYYMFSVLVSGIIYETAKEVAYGEDVYDKIKHIGGESAS
ncbi:ABC transporter permease [Sphingobacterium suaedae]|uniref:ABC transporter permease n=1 Tax=Sphingobacterium suaedae TaxID=1686402 RepID=A0ABW5KKU0_9SPHI